MLVVTRERGQQIMIGRPGDEITLSGPIVITLVRANGAARIGIEAPGLSIHRAEVYETIEREGETRPRRFR